MGTFNGYSGEIIYYLANLTCILLTLPIFYQLSSFIGNENEKLSLKMMLWSFIVYVLTDGFFVFYTCNSGLLPIWVMSLNSMLNQLSLFFVSYCWFWYGLVKLEIDLTKRMKLYLLINIVNLFIIMLIAVSPFLGLTYYYTLSGEYVRGPLFFVMAVLVFGYNLIVPIIAIFKSKLNKSPYSKKTAKSIVYFVLVPFFAGLFQMFFPYAPGVCLGFIIGLYFVYVDMLGGQIYTDSMTGLNNRRKAELYVTDLIQTASSHNAFYYYVLDIDYFKGINDKYGHLEGDRAIRLAANAIKKTIGEIRGFAARTGGDEFCVVVPENNLKSPEQMSTLLHKNLHQILQREHTPYNMQISVGFIKCDNSNTNVEELSANADQNLYQMKDIHHSEIKNN